MQQFESEHSSNIGWARWNEVTQRLEVDFKDKHGNKSSTYYYENYPANEWRLFQESKSKGRYFAEQIRTRYVGVKVGGAAKPEAAPVKAVPTSGDLF